MCDSAGFGSKYHVLLVVILYLPVESLSRQQFYSMFNSRVISTFSPNEDTQTFTATNNTYLTNLTLALCSIVALQVYVSQQQYSLDSPAEAASSTTYLLSPLEKVWTKNHPPHSHSLTFSLSPARSSRVNKAIKNHNHFACSFFTR